MRDTKFSGIFRIAPLWWASFAAWAIVLWVLSSLPSKDIPMPKFPMADKLVHGTYFAVGGGIFAVAAMATFSWRRKTVLLVTVVVMSVVGALDEWHQLSSKGRHGGDAGDWLADTIGGAIGAGAVILIYGYRRESETAGG